MLADRLSTARLGLPFDQWLPRLALVSAALVACSIALALLVQLNLGIDFTGGVVLEFQAAAGITISDVKAALANFPSAAVQEFGRADIFLIKIGTALGPETANRVTQEALAEIVVDWRRVESVGPAISSELARTAIQAVGLSLVVIMLYVWLRFEWQFAVGALLALVHDIVLTVGFFAISGVELNLPSVAAVLTIAGYSINDTVVIYDRIREYLAKHPKLPIQTVVAMALNASLSRTLVTSLTTLIALIALVVLGGSIIRDFALTMAFGVIVGTYSSLAVAGWIITRIEPVRDEERDTSQ